MTIPTLESMLEAGLHFGHKVSKWHPKMGPYIFTERKNIHILDLRKTAENLEKTADLFSAATHEGKTILLVGTKDQVKSIVKETGESLKIPYTSEKWIGGTLTNFPVIKKMINKYKTLIDHKATGKLSKYTKKEQLDFDKEIEKLQRRVGGLVNLNKVPDIIFIWDPKHEKTALNEANKKGIKVIAVCDTNVNPTGVDYVIPANDDAVKGAEIIFRVVKEAISEAQKNITK